MLARLFCFAVILLFPRLALAADPQAEAPPPACAPKDWKEVEEWREWVNRSPPGNAESWAKEARRIGNTREVWRWLDRLYLAADGGKVVTLADCSFGDNLRFYLYERYDSPGSFHVVRTTYYEDHEFALVMKKTGKLFKIPALPIWSPDKTRFAYGVCDQMNAKDDIAILRPAGDGLKAEVEGHMPCGMGECKVAWESATVLAATCPKAGDQGKEHKVMRYTRSGENWTATTSSR